MNIRAATAGDLPGIVLLLQAEGLPTEDLDENALRLFLVVEEHGAVKAVVGLERYADTALLRSLVVASELRGLGHGNALASAAEQLARDLGIASLYLLTTSADAFFRRRGYRAIHRDESPAAIKQTTQFSSLCPSTAVVMVKP